MPIEDLELLEALEDKIDLDAARKALAEKEPAIAWVKLKRELGINRWVAQTGLIRPEV